MNEKSASDLRWWKKEGEDIASTIFDCARRIRSAQDYRRQDDLVHASLYGDVEIFGFGPGSHARRPVSSGSQLSLNVVHNMVGACLSRIACKAKPKPEFVTNDGDWALSRRAKRLGQASDGAFYQTHFYPKSNMAFRDGAIFGSGHIRWGAHYEANRVYCHRVLPGEYLVSDKEGLYGEDGVRTSYFSRWYDRLVLVEQFPEAEAAIMAARIDDEDEQEFGYDKTSDQVLVREAWRLPSWPGAKDGMWARCIDGALLGDPRPYRRDRMPIASWRWDDALAGFYGRGLAYELRGLQLEINDLLDELQAMLHTVKGKWLVEEMSRVNPEHITDEADGILLYRGTQPIYLTPQIAPGEYYQHLWNLVAKAYEISGISQLAATSQKPAGISSGEGLRQMRDGQSERFLDKFESWDQFILRNTELAIDSMRDLAEVNGDKFEMTARRGGFKKALRADDFLIDEGCYELQIVPTSMLPSTPAGKIDFAQHMADIGVADPEELLELIAMPDTDRFIKRKLATRQLVEDMLETMVDTGVFTPPEPFMFWPTAMKVAVETYLVERSKGAPPDVLDLLSRWIVLANMQRQKESGAAPPPPPGGDAGAPPPGPPGPPNAMPPGPPGPPPPMPMAA